MRLEFFGTSHGLPEKNRFCSCTMLEAGGKKYIIDAGAPFTNFLIRNDIKPEEICAIFITHSHGDHMDGLPEFVDLASWYYHVETKIFLPNEQDIIALKAWNLAVNDKDTPRVDMLVYSDGTIYDDGVVKVTAFKTYHTKTSHGFIFEAEGKRVIFTGDLAGADLENPTIFDGLECDAVVCEDTHIEASMVARLVTGRKVKRLILNHISPKKERDIRDVEILAPDCNPIKAEDGMKIDI